MLLKSLKLNGFKSFAEKTHFEFHPGVTAIVGPNGCGKSNVVDAVRWVLGETSAKALRGGEMADVIFNGTDQRKPVGMAEVTLTLTDCEKELDIEFTEVAITRRVFRDGKSEYRINNQLCRLKDIHNLFMDTGIGRTAYSIMEQGKIDMLLSSKPEDRRTVFEEAAGITKFKKQKKEALRKLEYTEANLLRVADIVAEVKRQMNSLQRQAGKARRYQALLKDVEVLDTHHSYKKLAELKAEKSEFTTSIQSITKELEHLQNEIGEKESLISSERSQFQQTESRITETRHELTQKQNRIQDARNRIEFNKERIEELRALIEQHNQDVSTTKSKFTQQELDLNLANETLTKIKETISFQEEASQRHLENLRALQQSREAQEKELNLLQEKKGETESQLFSSKAELEAQRNQREANCLRIDQLAHELLSSTKEQEEKTEEETSLKQEIDTLTTKLRTEKEELESTQRHLQKYRNELETLHDQWTTVHRSLAEKTSRLEVLEQLIATGEGLSQGTQEVLKGLDGMTSGVRGLLGAFIDVEDPFLAAIDRALGAHLQTVLVSDSVLAENIVETLSKEKRGETTLISEDFIPPTSSTQMMTVPEGAICWAIDKVTSQSERLTPLLHKLLENVLIVPDLATALRLRREMPQTSFSTVRGEFISSLGIIRGGGKSESDSVLQRQSEINKLRAETVKLSSQLETLQKQKETKEKEIAALEKTLDENRERAQQIQVAQSTLEGKLSLIHRELQQVIGKAENLSWEKEKLQKRIEESEATITRLKENQTTSEKSLHVYQEKIEQLNQDLNYKAQQEAEETEILNDIRTKLAVEKRAHESAQQQREPMANRLQELQELIERRLQTVQGYEQRIEKSGEESTELEETITRESSSLHAVEQTLEKFVAEKTEKEKIVLESEETLSTLRHHLSKLNEQRGKEEIKSTQLELKIDNLTSSVKERYGIDLENFSQDLYTLMVAIEEQKKAHQRRAKRQATREGIHSSPAAEENTPEPPTPDPLEEGAEPDWEFVGQIMGELKQRLESMGPVNLEAIQEFEELQERHDFLEKQHTDLTNSKKELLQVIAKINRTTRQLFAETFEKVRENFKHVFKELFGQGARADLVLLDESDPLESGIDIIAKPPGKKLQSISLLSGGERSMTAVAMLFSIYMVKPSPFCILDELDAPLDEANIGRFLQMLERFISQSQFVIVTHNKRTMNRADVLYGVTMQEFGISKPVGVKLSSKEEKKAEPAAS